MSERDGTPRAELSVVIPFFNEEGNVEPLFAELLPVLDALGRPFEIVAVDDGSSDRTPTELRAAARRHGRTRLLRLARNSGQTAAFDAGFKAARGRLIVTLDGDRQIDPHDIPPMIRRLEESGVDLVHGWRRERQDDFVKRVSTRVANGVRNWLTRQRVRDTGCPLKVFRAEVLRGVELYDGMHRFFVEIAHLHGHRTLELPVRHRPRVAGRTKYGIRNRILRGLRDCFAVRLMMARRLHYQVLEEPAGAWGEGSAPDEAPGGRAGHGG